MQSSQQTTGAPVSLLHKPKDQGPQAGLGPNFSLMPRFMFGFKSDVANSIHFLDADVVAYPCGHNVVLFNQVDRSQRFIPGLEGSEGITAMALSSSKRHLAVCEKSDRAVCTIYNVGRIVDQLKSDGPKAGGKRILGPGAITYDHQSIKTKRILSSADSKSTHFISADFCHNEEKKQIVTLSMLPEAKVIVWQWDKQKCVAFADVTVPAGCQVQQISYSPLDHSTILITGKDIFKFYSIKENNTMKLQHASMPKKEPEISKNYKCHAWLHDGRFIVCTDIGQIMLFEANGDYKQVQIFDSKKPAFPIHSVIPFQIGGVVNEGSNGGAKSGQRCGFVVAGDSGTLRVYVKSDSTQMPYKRVESDKDDLYMTSDYERTKDPHKLSIFLDVKYHKITHMCLSPREDQLLFSTDTSQIISVKINLDKPSEETFPYDYLVSSFHSKPIYGLSLCIKKQLIATCSNDRSIRLWSYNNQGQFKLELRQQFPEEAYSLALHPSGFHLVIGFQESLKMVNILDNNLALYKEFPSIKGCKEIQFAHGGQYFACASGSNVQVFKFYTAESPPEFFFHGQQNPIKCIHWLPDDTGFITSGSDQGVLIWSLYPPRGTEESKEAKAKVNLPQSEFKTKTCCFSSLACANKGLEQNLAFYAAGNDRSLREVVQTGKDTFNERRYEEGTQYSQIIQSHSRKFLLASTNNEGKPSGIQAFRTGLGYVLTEKDEKVPRFLEKILEVPAHHLKLTRMCLNFDNTKLFTVGSDAALTIFQVNDKEPFKKPTNKEQKEQMQAPLPVLTLSEEVLIEKEKRDKIQEDIQRYKDDINMEKVNNEEQIRSELNRQREIINKHEAVLKGEKDEFEQKLDELEKQRESEDLKNEEALNLLESVFREEVNLKNKDFNMKKSQDEQRYGELVRLKEKQSNDFSNKISELYLLQEKQLKDLQTENALAQKQKDQEIKELDQKISELLKDNKIKRKEIEDKAWEDIDVIKEKNKDDLAVIIDMGMISKAKLTEVTGSYRTQKALKEQLMTKIAEKSTQLYDLISLTKDLENNIASQKSELAEREATIQDKDKRIRDLKKKTQELEKFKFVLDYKIKELKRDIGPRQEQLAKLGENTETMMQEVQHFTRVNNNLTLITEDLRMRQSGLIKEKEDLQKVINKQEAEKKEFVDDVYETLLKIEEYKGLKKALVLMYKKWVLEECKSTGSNQQTSNDLRKHLENKVIYFKDQMTRTSNEAKNVRGRFMKENVMLLQEINVLKQAQHNKLHELYIVGQAQGIGVPQQNAFDEENKIQELQMQDMMIADLQNQIEQFKQQNQTIRNRRGVNGQTKPMPLEFQNPGVNGVRISQSRGSARGHSRGSARNAHSRGSARNKNAVLQPITGQNNINANNGGVTGGGQEIRSSKIVTSSTVTQQKIVTTTQHQEVMQSNETAQIAEGTQELINDENDAMNTRNVQEELRQMDDAQPEM